MNNKLEFEETAKIRHNNGMGIIFQGVIMSIIQKFINLFSLGSADSNALNVQTISKSIQAKNTSKSKSFSNYNPPRSRNIYDPLSVKPYKLSRSKLELFMRCKRCFYIDRRLGVGHPSGYPFSLNIAVDELLKKEFDIYRLEQKVHPHPLRTYPKNN